MTDPAEDENEQVSDAVESTPTRVRPMLSSGMCPCVMVPVLDIESEKEV